MLRVFAMDRYGQRVMLNTRVPANRLSEIRKLIMDMGFILIAEAMGQRAAVRRHILTFI